MSIRIYKTTKFLSWIAAGLILAAFVLSCKQPNASAPETFASLILKTLTIFGKAAISGRIIVDNDKTEVRADDVSAGFSYGDVTDEIIPVIVTNGTLNTKDSIVTLSVPAVAGEYKAWNMNLRCGMRVSDKQYGQRYSTRFN